MLVYSNSCIADCYVKTHIPATSAVIFHFSRMFKTALVMDLLILSLYFESNNCSSISSLLTIIGKRCKFFIA